MKSIFIGSVLSSQIALQAIIDTGFPIDYVFSLGEEYSKDVSGYYPIHETAEKNHIPYRKFKKIGDKENVDLIREIQPDYIFVIGISQLVKKDIMDCAKQFVIGFHPTPLPKYRGRAAMVWQVLLGVHDTKISIFKIDDGMDSGDILGQEDYIIEDTDYADVIEDKLNDALARLMPKVLRQIMDGTLQPIPQKEEEAIYLLIRRPEDGLIDWKEPVEKIQRLIRAVSRPYPGAFGMYDGSHQIIIWRADYLVNNKYIGIPGQICEIHEDHFDIVGVDGIIRVTDYENVDKVKLLVGHKLK